VEENQRLLEGCKDLENGRLDLFGQKMFASHEGLTTLYEVSCPELDLLVEEVSARKEVIGSRMMGGGFGGCTINIIKEEAVEELSKLISGIYKEKTGNDMAVYPVKIEDGTSLLT